MFSPSMRLPNPTKLKHPSKFLSSAENCYTMVSELIYSLEVIKSLLKINSETFLSENNRKMVYTLRYMHSSFHF